MESIQIKTMIELEKFLRERIFLRSSEYSAGFGLKRTKYFLRLLGNPQNKIKVIHIAGTSGKGSTATLTSQMLISQGFNVGLSLSPHVIDIRERFQINNKLSDEKVVIKYFNQILPAINQASASNYGSPTYFEIIVGLAFYIFWKEGLDYAVIETGLGGLYDGTNCVSNRNKIVVLTKIGLDHMRILGKNITEIAFQKASIIHSRNNVITIRQCPSAQRIITKVANENNAPVQWIMPNRDYVLRDQFPDKIVLDINLQKSFKNIELSLGGIHQAENCALAFACVLLCSEKYKFPIQENSLRQALKNLSIAGRMQQVKLGKKTIILDGAHNPQKMNSLTKSLIKAYPGKKFSFLVGFKHGKDYKRMLKKIIPIASNISITNFLSNQENYPKSVESKEIAKFLKSENFKKFTIIDNSPQNVLSAINKSKDVFVITGSFYLIASVYRYFKKNETRNINL